MTSLEFFVLGAAVAASIHLTWFQSSIAPHLSQLLRWCGWHKNDSSFWPDDEVFDTWLFHEWAAWASLSLPSLLAELLTCPVCLSWHISFWTAIVFTIVFPVPWYWAGMFAAWPCVILYLNRK